MKLIKGKVKSEVTGSNLDGQPYVSQTMDFKGKTVGVITDVPHVAKYVSATTFGTPASFLTEFGAANYTSIVTQGDGNSTSIGNTTGLNYYAQQLFAWDVLNDLKRRGKVPQNWTVADLIANIQSLTMNAYCYGVGVNGGVPAYGATCKMWHNDTSAWFDRGTPHTASTPTAISPNLTGSLLGVAIDPATGIVNALLHPTYPSDGSGPSTIYTDYVSLTVEVLGESVIVSPLSEGRNGRLAPNRATQIGGVYHTTKPTRTDGQGGALETDSENVLMVSTRHNQNSLTIVAAVAITDTSIHDYNLITHGLLTEDQIRRFGEFKISCYNTHNQAATVALYTANRSVGSTSVNSAGLLYAEATNLASSGSLVLQAGATATGAATTQKAVPALKGLHSNLIVRVTFGSAPASGALTIVVEMQ